MPQESAWTLLWSAVSSTLATIIMASFGAVLTKMGVLTPNVSKGISKLVKDVAVPCLLFARVAGSISVSTLIAWLPIPVAAITNTLFGCLIGYATAKICGLSPAVTRFTMVSVGFTNTNTIPLAFMQTLAAQIPTVFETYPHESVDDINSRGQTFILTYNMAVTFLRWTLADRMLDHKQGDTPDIMVRRSTMQDKPPKDNPETIISEPVLSPAIPQQKRLFFTILGYLKKIFDFFPMPLWACVLAVIIGLTPARDLFFKSDNFKTPPLNFATIAITSIGATVTPLINLVLGSKLLKGPKGGTLNAYLLILISWLKLVMIPLLFGIGVIYLCGHSYTHWITDNTMLFVLLMESACPPALLLLMMCTANDFMVDEMTSLVFYSYIGSILTLTVACFSFLLLL